MRYEIKYTTFFKKELEQAKKQHKNLDKLFYVINMLASGRPLEAKYKDHNLAGVVRRRTLLPLCLGIGELFFLLMLFTMLSNSRLHVRKNSPPPACGVGCGVDWSCFVMLSGIERLSKSLPMYRRGAS